MVEVLHYETANKNKTIGYADIRVPILKPTVIIFRKVAHVQSGDRRWFSIPSFARGERQDGSPNYLKYWELETQVHNNQLLDCLSEKVKKFCEKFGIEEVESMNFDTFPNQVMDERPF